MTTSSSQNNPSPIAMTTEIVTAYLSNNTLAKNELPDLILQVHSTVQKADNSTVTEAPAADRKVTKQQIRKSIRPDALISFIDGKPYKVLKRHLAKHGTTPEGYRAMWGLPADYPMVAESYSSQRSALARQNGLGQAGAGEGAAEQDIPTPNEQPKRGTRRTLRKASAPTEESGAGQQSQEPVAAPTQRAAKGRRTKVAAETAQPRTARGRTAKAAEAESAQADQQQAGKTKRASGAAKTGKKSRAKTASARRSKGGAQADASA